MSALLKKLGLGTVQFGLDYGVTNERGRVSSAEAAAIIDSAILAGVETFDTAAVYGASEEVLGSALEAHPGVHIISKLPGIAGERIDGTQVERCRLVLEQTLRRLRRPSLYGLLLHRTDDLRKPGSELIGSFLDNIKQAGLVSKIGVSVYSPADVELALDRIPVDLVQLPLSLLDQRALQNGTLESLRRHGIEVHARSVFLQGVLLSDPDRLPSHFHPYRDRLVAVGRAAEAAGTERLAFCLRFVLEQRDVACAIVGVTGLTEWQQIAAATQQTVLWPGDLAGLASNQSELINPSLWPNRAP